MVKTLEDMIARMRKLPEGEQELLARFVLHELDDDQAWRQAGELHGEGLARLVDQIIAEDDRGERPDLDVGQL
jgi:hypothetical protein